MITVRVPFRMSFFGGGSDFPDFYRLHGGTVLSTAINKYCYVTLRALPPLFDYKSEFVYSKTERVRENSEILHPAIREAMIWKRVEGVRLTYDADLPARSGLGTSSSFAVGMMHAIHVMRGEAVTPRLLADEAIYLERTLCRECGGVQDQIAAAFGGLNRIDFDEKGYTVTPLLINEARKKALEDHLMLFFTGTSRFSAELQVAHQASLVTKQSELARMAEMAREACELLENDMPLSRFGEMLHEAWQIKRGVTNEITNDTVDAYYERAMAAGALGGKLLGAGGGGFLLFFVEREKRAAVRAALPDLAEIPFAFEDKGSQIVMKN